ncbi:MAG: TIGR02597 family protein, partial [Chthoniobacterales bacterium]
MKSFAFSLIATTVLAAHTLAQTTATTDPVGFVSYTVNANSDQKVGVPMTQADVFSGAATAVSGTSVTTSGVPTLSGKNLLLVTSGSAAGSWEEIASSTGTTVTLVAPISGFANSNSFVIRPFWTLSSLFPNGGAVPISPDPENPTGLVLLNDLAALGI